jgi:mitotic spindle assembly checkpoint protein MAD1
MRIYAHSTWKSKNLQSGPCSTKAHAFKLQVLREELTNDSTRIKKHAEIRHVVFTMGKLIHFPTFSLPFALEEKEKATQKDREKIEELELRGEIGAGRHVLPDVQVLSLSANPAQDWAPSPGRARQAQGRERNAASAPLRPRGIQHTQRTHCHRHRGRQVQHGGAPRASWAAVFQEMAQLEDEPRQKGKRMLRLRQVFAAKTAEFREALSAILSVNVVSYDNAQVRVTSQYDLGAAFVFQPAQQDAATKDGGTGNSGAARMQLVARGEGGPQELPQLMRNWVGIEQSISCFLVSVTLECYNKWKRKREMSGVGVLSGSEGGNCGWFSVYLLCRAQYIICFLCTG